VGDRVTVRIDHRQRVGILVADEDPVVIGLGCRLGAARRDGKQRKGGCGASDQFSTRMTHNRSNERLTLKRTAGRRPGATPTFMWSLVFDLEPPPWRRSESHLRAIDGGETHRHRFGARGCDDHDRKDRSSRRIEIILAMLRSSDSSSAGSILSAAIKVL